VVHVKQPGLVLVRAMSLDATCVWFVSDESRQFVALDIPMGCAEVLDPMRRVAAKHQTMLIVTPRCIRAELQTKLSSCPWSRLSTETAEQLSRKPQDREKHFLLRVSRKSLVDPIIIHSELPHSLGRQSLIHYSARSDCLAQRWDRAAWFLRSVLAINTDHFSLLDQLLLCVFARWAADSGLLSMYVSHSSSIPIFCLVKRNDKKTLSLSKILQFKKVCRMGA